MTEDQEVDYDSLGKLCEFLIQKGAHALLPNGSTGEMALLSVAERKKVLSCTLDAVGGRIPVFSMVGAAATADTVELARHAESCGADGIGVVTPYYYRLEEAALEEHFVRVAGSVSRDFPVYLYAIPQLAGNDITPGLAERITARCPNVIGIKYSYPDMERIMGFQTVNGGRFSVLTGVETLFYPALCTGADGTVSSAAGVVPEQFAAIYGAFLKGDLQAAKSLQFKVNSLLEITARPNGAALYKILLRHLGVIACSAVRAPMLAPARREEEAFLSKTLPLL